MKASVMVICRPGVATGFALAGMETAEVTRADEAAMRLREVLDDTSVGVVLMDEGFHRHLPDDLRRQLARLPQPIVVPLPGVERDDQVPAADSYIVELLRQVIGYRVRLK